VLVKFTFLQIVLPNRTPASVEYQPHLAIKMVHYFTSNTTTPSAFIYVGKDKVESEHMHTDPKTPQLEA
jgi:hypothetical protein